MNCFYSDIIIDNEYIALSPEESRHCVKILRKKIGDTVYVIDGKGNLYHSVIHDDNLKKCILSIEKQIKDFNKLNYNLHIAIAPTKSNDRFEWFLEKATEIGVSEITPILCKQSERKVIKNDRLEKVLISATKQSQQAFIPKLNKLTNYNEFIKSISESNSVKCIAWCDYENPTMFKDIITKSNDVILLIGPEGDFSDDEVKLAKKNNFIEVSLGKNRLRTETAGVYAAGVMSVINS